MPSKQEILDEIKRTAEENGGKPLGSARFEKETGIKPHEWGKYWARFGDAQKDAGLAPNQLQDAYSHKLLIEKLIGLTRKLQKFPTSKELYTEKYANADFPSHNVFSRLGSKQELIKKVVEFCKSNPGLDDVLALCEPLLEKGGELKERDEKSTTEKFGEVYLFKSGRYYKIGKTFDTVRRGNEIRIQLPEQLDLIHSIKTDDPSGVETYWHNRFDLKRLKGEWFDLNSADIKAFKRWKRIY